LFLLTNMINPDELMLKKNQLKSSGAGSNGDADTAAAAASVGAASPAKSESKGNASEVKAEKQHYVGLINQGATCYMNSALQTLFMTPEFRAAVLRWTYVKEEGESEAECIPLQLQKLFGKLALSSSNAISTIDLTKSFGDNFVVYQQQDIQELLRILMDRLEEAMKASRPEADNETEDLSASKSNSQSPSCSESNDFINSLFGFDG